jgi:hypothetical protein
MISILYEYPIRTVTHLAEIMEPAPKRQKSTACSGCADLFIALKAQHPACISQCLAEDWWTVDWRLAKKLLWMATSHPEGVVAIDATFTPDCTACLQAVLQHSFFSLVQQHTECHQRTLSEVVARSARSGCAACLTQLLSTQRVSLESWKIAMCRVLPHESSKRLSALKLLLAAAPESMQPELCQYTLRESVHSRPACAAVLIPLMDCWLQSGALANRPDVHLELLTMVVENGCADCLNHLVVTHKADVNAVTHGSKRTLLQDACLGRGRYDSAIVQALIQHGADVFGVTADRGNNVLHMSTSYAELDCSCVHIAAAVVSQANRDYKTAATAQQQQQQQ